MTVLCKKYPQLHVYDLKVRFVDGKAEVDEKTADALKKMDGYSFEFSESEGGAGDDVFAGLSIDELKAYAAEHGIDIGRSTSASGIIEKIKAAEEGGAGDDAGD